jgi:hypothetical protein
VLLRTAETQRKGANSWVVVYAQCRGDYAKQVLERKLHIGATAATAASRSCNETVTALVKEASDDTVVFSLTQSAEGPLRAARAGARVRDRPGRSDQGRTAHARVPDA